ncbi:uncharacterized protein LOC132715963 [Ruditapes philippinarum]|uniref:uncharacterized protein LOC132715963 n=1 Tax=Ruditapes philippinarum TaxID=129788 RepID=UPI00295B2FD3|nr:uncharacterized protein LOC132715963 [Ruditapes philippinarum]
MVMDKTMGKFGIEHVNECLLTKLRETQQAVTDSLGPCIGEYYRLIKMSLVLNYEYNINHSNPESKEFLDRKFSLRHLIKTSVKEVQATDNMFVLVKEFMPAVIENNPDKEFIKANVELLVSLPNDPTTLFEWTKLHGELVTQEEILKVDLIEDSRADEPDDGEDRLPTTTTKPVPLR